MLTTVLAFCSGCGSEAESETQSTDVFQKATAWALFRGGFHLCYPKALGRSLSWTWDVKGENPREGLFALLGDTWQGDGTSLPAGRRGTLSIRDGKRPLAQQDLTLPDRDFLESPRLALGPSSARLAWKLRGKLPVQVRWQLEGQKACIQRASEEGDFHVPLPASFQGKLSWRLFAAGRLLAEASLRTGFREVLEFPIRGEYLNLVDDSPIVLGDELIVLMSSGYVASMAPVPSKEGTRFEIRWLWTEELSDSSSKTCLPYRDLWPCAKGRLEVLRKDGKIFRLDVEERRKRWLEASKLHPQMSPRELLALPELCRLDGSRGEGSQRLGCDVELCRHVASSDETLLLTCSADYGEIRLFQRSEGKRSTLCPKRWKMARRWKGKGLLDLISMEAGRFLAVTQKPSRELSILPFHRGSRGWIVGKPVDLAKTRGAKLGRRAHCPTVAMPGRNLALIGVQNELLSVVLPPDGVPVVAKSLLPGRSTVYVEGIVALSPHRAVALLLEPPNQVALMGEISREVHLVEIALEDPLKPKFGCFTVITNNLRLQGAWHVESALHRLEDRLLLVLGSEVAITDAKPPFTLRHRFAAYQHDRYLNRGFLMGRRLLAFHKGSGLMGIDLID